MSTAQTTTAMQSGTRKSPCRCHDQTPAQACCCHLVCLERPNYFCGHLLTDADLTLGQKYVIEKNKLYHRALDGYGIACGLKITCDPQCCGHILIHDGYAIDDCGNDLVVCETQRFDVIAALKDKKLLVSEPHQEECEPRHRKPRCEIKQCFYITICYDEQESDYETPYQNGCTSGPQQCVPTRTREAVRFDVTCELPRCDSYLEELEKRLGHCFEIYCDGPIGQILKKHIKELQFIVEGKTGNRLRELGCNPCELFCNLRAYFLNHLKVRPDEFSCGLGDEVCRLVCPEEFYEDREESVGETAMVFRKLLTYMQRYQFDCAFGELVFSCEQPCEAKCLVLGTVEVVDGKLMRVSNTPRKYLWSPANLVPVLLHDILSLRLAQEERKEGDAEGGTLCCPDYPAFKPEDLLREFEFNPCGRLDAATSIIEAFEAVAKALHRSFDFTDTTAISQKLFGKLSEGRLKRAEKELDIQTSVSDELVSQLSYLSPVQALAAHTLIRPKDAVVAYKTSKDEIGAALPNFVVNAISPDRTAGARLGKIAQPAKPESRDSAEQAKGMAEEIASLKGRLANLEEQVRKGAKRGGGQQSEDK